MPRKSKKDQAAELAISVNQMVNRGDLRDAAKLVKSSEVDEDVFDDIMAQHANLRDVYNRL